MGRPKKVDEDKKKYCFSIRFTKAEMVAILKKSKKKGMKHIDYVRWCTLRTLVSD